jgi:hypothetical protein
MARIYYGLVIRFVDIQTNEFLELGGVVFRNRRSQMDEWNRIPKASGETSILLDREKEFDLEDTHCITAETACALLHKPLGELIGAGRKRLGTPTI